jgi:S-formylglutathione hydrolase FrmB
MRRMPKIDDRVRALTINSAVLGIEKLCYVYMPPEAEAGQRLPTLYLLRSHEREWVNRREDETRGNRTVVDMYLQQRRLGAIGPLILVMPGLASDDNRFPSVLNDCVAPELAGEQNGMGSGRFMSYFFEELLPFIDTQLPTIPVRGVTGFSLGGLMSVLAAARRPDLFVSVGAYDATILYSAESGQRFRPTDRVLDLEMFDAALGVPRDFAYISENSPISLLMRADREALKQLTWLIQYGPEEIEPWGSNYYRNEHLLRALAALGIQNAVPGPLPDGRHTWHFADQHVAETLPFHWEAMKKRMYDPVSSEQ